MPLWCIDTVFFCLPFCLFLHMHLRMLFLIFAHTPPSCHFYALCHILHRFIACCYLKRDLSISSGISRKDPFTHYPSCRFGIVWIPLYDLYDIYLILMIVCLMAAGLAAFIFLYFIYLLYTVYAGAG